MFEKYLLRVADSFCSPLLATVPFCLLLEAFLKLLKFCHLCVSDSICQISLEKHALRLADEYSSLGIDNGNSYFLNSGCWIIMGLGS